MTTPMTEREGQLNTWLTIIKGEYQEMPGLHLTKRQVRRLWGLDEPMCDALLDRLQHLRFLRITPDGCYVLNDGAPGACAGARREGSSSTLSYD